MTISFMGHPHMLTRATLDMLFGSPYLQTFIRFSMLIIPGGCPPTSLLGYGFLGIG